MSNRKIKVFSHVAAAVICFVFFLLAFWIYQKGIDRAAERAAERVMEEMRQQAAEGQEDSGSVTIYKNDGTVWGYFGEARQRNTRWKGENEKCMYLKIHMV